MDARTSQEARQLDFFRGGISGPVDPTRERLKLVLLIFENYSDTSGAFFD
jgi:hypothetical protein